MRARPFAWALLAGALLAACAAPPQLGTVADRLSEPRGMALDGQGGLLVAEAGAAAEPVTPPVTANQSGRLTRVGPAGERATLAERLPYQLDTASGTSVGPTDVAIVGGETYLLTGEGGQPLSRALLRVSPGQEPEIVASFLAFALRGNLEGQMSGAAGVQANPYAMVATPAGDALMVSDGASGRVLRVALPGGAISVFAAVPGMPPLTGLAYGPDGRLYVTMFSTLPHPAGSGAIWAADASGAIAPAVERLTMPIDVAFDDVGAMLVLEFSDGRSPKQPYAPGQGRLLRIDQRGQRRVVVDRLDYPTAMLRDPGGDLLIALGGAFRGAGEGRIVRLRCADLGEPAACPAP